MFQQHNAKNPGVIYLRKFFLIFGELYTGLLKYFHGRFKFFNVKKNTIIFYAQYCSYAESRWFCIESVVIINTA